MAMEDVKQLVRELLEEVKSLEAKLDEVVKPLEETSSTIPMASGSLEDVIKFTERYVHQIMGIINDLIHKNGIEKCYEEVKDVKVVGEAKDGEETVRLALKLKSDKITKSFACFNKEHGKTSCSRGYSSTHASYLHKGACGVAFKGNPSKGRRGLRWDEA